MTEHKSRTLALLFTNRISFFSQIISWIQYNYQVLKKTWPWVLEPKNKFSGNWSQMINQVLGPEPDLWFSQTRSPFIQNYMVNSMKLPKQVLGHLSQNDLPSKSRTNVKCTTCIWQRAQHVEIYFFNHISSLQRKTFPISCNLKDKYFWFHHI